MQQVTIRSSVGDIVVEIDSKRAPLTSEFFLGLVAQGHYRASDIYRTTRLGVEQGPFLLQGGSSLPYLQDKAQARQSPMLETIETTTLTGLSHKRGTFSLARDLNKTGYALTEFFVCLGDFPTLDEGGRNLLDSKGFPAFGQVLSGLTLLDDIAGQETGASTHVPILKGQMLKVPIKIENILLD